MRGFVLLEVLVSLVILSLGATAVMQSLRQSLKASQHAQVVNQAALLAESLMEEVQVSPPEPGKYEGDFGEDAPNFRYVMTVDEETLRYRGEDRKADRDDFRPLRTVHVEIFRDVRQGRDSVRIISIDSAVLGIQKFTSAALNEYQLFELY